MARAVQPGLAVIPRAPSFNAWLAKPNLAALPIMLIIRRRRQRLKGEPMVEPRVPILTSIMPRTDAHHMPPCGILQVLFAG